jgi:CBS domain-containing protein
MSKPQKMLDALSTNHVPPYGVFPRPDYKPVGIITDRDLVLRVLATGDDPQTVTLGTVMKSS